MTIYSVIVHSPLHRYKCIPAVFLEFKQIEIFGQFFLQVISIISKGSPIQHFLGYMQAERQNDFSSCSIRM